MGTKILLISRGEYVMPTKDSVAQPPVGEGRIVRRGPRGALRGTKLSSSSLCFNYGIISRAGMIPSVMVIVDHLMAVPESVSSYHESALMRMSLVNIRFHELFRKGTQSFFPF